VLIFDCITEFTLCRCCLLQVVGVYGDLDLGVSLTHEDAFRMVVCLRKQGQPADAAQ
jgi:hypothetical protein